MMKIDWVCRQAYYEGHCDALSEYECMREHGLVISEDQPRGLTDEEIEILLKPTYKS